MTTRQQIILDILLDNLTVELKKAKESSQEEFEASMLNTAGEIDGALANEELKECEEKIKNPDFDIDIKI